MMMWFYVLSLHRAVTSTMVKRYTMQRQMKSAGVIAIALATTVLWTNPIMAIMYHHEDNVISQMSIYHAHSESIQKNEHRMIIAARLYDQSQCNR